MKERKKERQRKKEKNSENDRNNAGYTAAPVACGWAGAVWPKTAKTQKSKV